MSSTVDCPVISAAWPGWSKPTSMPAAVPSTMPATTGVPAASPVAAAAARVTAPTTSVQGRTGGSRLRVDLHGVDQRVRPGLLRRCRKRGKAARGNGPCRRRRSACGRCSHWPGATGDRRHRRRAPCRAARAPWARDNTGSMRPPLIAPIRSSPTWRRSQRHWASAAPIHPDQRRVHRAPSSVDGTKVGAWQLTPIAATRVAAPRRRSPAPGARRYRSPATNPQDPVPPSWVGDRSSGIPARPAPRTRHPVTEDGTWSRLCRHRCRVEDFWSWLSVPCCVLRVACCRVQ